MPAKKTEITEIITGLGMLGERDLTKALAKKPGALEGVPEKTWEMLGESYRKGEHDKLFKLTFEIGRDFLLSNDGLRNKIPYRIEWKGNHRGPAFELVPADLRIDRVYLVSCKFFSKILLNPGTSHLFEECLKTRPQKSVAKDWFAYTGGKKYENLYKETCEWFRRTRSIVLTSDVKNISPEDRDLIKSTFKLEKWPQSLLAPYVDFCAEVSKKSVQILNSKLEKHNQKLDFFWRLIRLQPAPYFLLGSFTEKGITKSLKLRIDTPWDWNNEFELNSFIAYENVEAGQPTVQWKADIECKSSAKIIEVKGHIEIRWSHGKFCGNPEAKVYLDTPHETVPGYFKVS